MKSCKTYSIPALMVGLGLALFHSSHKPIPQDYRKSVVRLVNDGKFFCSGFVVNSHTIITAAHCVNDPQPIMAADDRTIEVRAEDNQPSDIRARVKGVNRRGDLAVLEGNFSMFPAIDMQTELEPAKQQLYNSNHMVSCGYPWGGHLVCTEVTELSQFNFGFRGQAVLYPGMSGGPVINLESMQVVALNTAAMANTYYFSPTIEIYPATER